MWLLCWKMLSFLHSNLREQEVWAWRPGLHGTQEIWSPICDERRLSAPVMTAVGNLLCFFPCLKYKGQKFRYNLIWPQKASSTLNFALLLKILQISHMNIEILAASNIYIVWLVVRVRTAWCLVSDICCWLWGWKQTFAKFERKLGA